MATANTIRLTDYSTCYGCASKVGPVELDEMLKTLSVPRSPQLLVGLESPDDAAVYRLDDDRALIHTVDYFTPIVDEPYTFGAIAAANALSDVYAMGGSPFMALSVAGFPEELPPEIARAVLQGGADKAAEAGVVVAGGHTVMNKEPMYGLAVTGLVHPGRVLHKRGAHPGDRLFLTKPLGTGVIVTAHEKGHARADHLEGAIDSMLQLNRRASELIEETGIHSVTDVTGYGLVGHGAELARQSGVGLRIELDLVPLLDGVAEYAYRGVFPCRLRRNRDYLIEEGYVTVREGLEVPLATVLFDPQTSGGLLFAAPEESAGSLVRRFRDCGEQLWEIGKVREGGGITIT